MKVDIVSCSNSIPQRTFCPYSTPCRLFHFSLSRIPLSPSPPLNSSPNHQARDGPQGQQLLARPVDAPSEPRRALQTRRVPARLAHHVRDRYS